MINIEKKTFESLFNLYYSGLIVYANRFTNQIEISEDIVHDVFITLWEKKIHSSWNLRKPTSSHPSATVA